MAAGAWLARSQRTYAAAPSPGGTELSLESDGLSARWSVESGSLRMVALYDRYAGRPVPLPREAFTLTFEDGRTLDASAMPILAAPEISAAESFVLFDQTSGAQVTWRAIAVERTNYLRQEITIEATRGPLAIRSVRMLEFKHLPDAEVAGACDGSPVVAGTLFAAIEHPFAQADAIYDRASIDYPRKLDVQPGVPLELSCVIGASRPGQLRRDFLAYLERERARPYAPFLHYNSWYDIGYFTRYDQADCLNRIAAVGTELAVKRGVRPASFLFDDGWDDPNVLWTFNAGFPDGFAPLKSAAAAYGAKPGVWLSPWGGYGKPRQQRLASAKRDGYEIDADGLALSGPKYYEYFHSVAMGFVQRGGINQIKLDGTGDTTTVAPGSRFGSNFAAAIALIRDLRAADPGLYVNLTTGTYPSPFWLRYCDSIWRGGNDHDFAGEGSHRQRWVTYRDADTYAGIVTQGPLYPLNSVMLHGLIYAQHALHLADDPSGYFRNEVRSYFGTGTQLQEMYVTPSLLSARDWDDVAAGARWSARNAGVLRDTHWIGGNPARLDAYGWASWTPDKSILVLRNPRKRAQTIALDAADAFELPPGAKQRIVLEPVWESPGRGPVELRAGHERAVRLEPFEVLVLETA